LPEVDAVVVSLKSRSIEAQLAVDKSRAAEAWLRGRGASHVLFKICSTFDSTDKGNIGPSWTRCAPIPAKRSCW